MTIKTLIKLFSVTVLYITAIISGYLLSKNGKPYNSEIFTIHKISAVLSIGLAVYYIIKYLRKHKLNNAIILLTIISFFSAILLILTGVLISVKKTSPNIIVKVHGIAPYILLFSFILLFYFLIKKYPRA